MDMLPTTALPILCLRSPRFLLSMYASILRTRNAGRRLFIACEMAFRFSRQPRQNFTSSLFCNPHFGQYIYLIQAAAEPSLVPMRRSHMKGAIGSAPKSLLSTFQSLGRHQDFSCCLMLASRCSVVNSVALA